VHVDPQILLVDEVIAVGDEEFQRRCFEHLANLRNKGTTIVLVTHSLPLVQAMCDKATWMDHGEVKATGDAIDVVRQYLGEVNRQEEVALANATPEEVRESGRGILVIEGVEFLDPSGEHTQVGHTNDALTVRVHWKANEPVDWPLVSFAVESEGGQHLAGTGMERSVKGVGPFEGTGTADYVIDRLPLAPGGYVINVAAHDQHGHAVLDRVDAAAKLFVRPGDRIVPGLLDLGGRWQPPLADKGR
jgi:hypothetical protein